MPFAAQNLNTNLKLDKLHQCEASNFYSMVFIEKFQSYFRRVQLSEKKSLFITNKAHIAARTGQRI